MSTSIKKIAEDLSLGQSTVAFALSGTGRLSAQTRRRVIEHANRLGYVPNRNAQRIRSSRTGVVGLIVPDVVLSPYVEVVQHLFRKVEEAGQELRIALTEFNFALEDRACRSMLASRVDGLIIKSGYGRWEDVPQDHYLRRAVSESLPVVLYSNPIEGSGLPYMKHPNIASAKVVTRHLVELGHRRIGLLMPGVKPFGGAYQAWISAVREQLAQMGSDAELEIVALPPGTAGLEGTPGVFPEYVNQHHPQHALPMGRQLLRTAMDLPDPPTALLAYSDPVAIGAICAAQSLNLKLGRDVAIAGCAQMPTSYFSPVSLTTADRRPHLYAQKLLDLLASRMGSGKQVASVAAFDEVEPLLVLGESTVGG